MNRFRTFFGIMLTALLLLSASGFVTGAQEPATPEAEPDGPALTEPVDEAPPPPELPEETEQEEILSAGSLADPEPTIPGDTGEVDGEPPVTSSNDTHPETGPPADGSSPEEPVANEDASTPESGPAAIEAQIQQDEPVPGMGPLAEVPFAITAFTCTGYLEASIPQLDEDTLQVEFRADAIDAWGQQVIYRSAPSAGIYGVQFQPLGFDADHWIATVTIIDPFTWDSVSVTAEISGCAADVPEWPDDDGPAISYARLDCSGLLTIKHTRGMNARIDILQTIDSVELIDSRIVELIDANITHVQFDFSSGRINAPYGKITDLDQPWNTYGVQLTTSLCHDPLENQPSDPRITLTATCTGDVSARVDADLLYDVSLAIMFPPSNSLALMKNLPSDGGWKTYSHNFNLTTNTRNLRVSALAQTPERTISAYLFVDCSHLQPPPPTEFPILMEGVICPRSECWLASDEREWTARFTISPASTGIARDYVVPVWSDGRFGITSEDLPIGIYEVCLDHLLTASNGDTHLIMSTPRCTSVAVNDDLYEEHIAMFVIRDVNTEEPPAEETPTPTPIMTPEPVEAVLSTSLTLCSDADCAGATPSQAEGYSVEWTVTNEASMTPDDASAVSLTVTGVVEGAIATGSSGLIPVGTYRVCLTPVLTGPGGEPLRIADDAMCMDIELAEDGHRTGAFTVVLDPPGDPEEPEEPVEPEEPEAPSPLEQVVRMLIDLLRRLFRGFFP